MKQAPHIYRPLAAEVVKNLALAGVGRLFVVDDASSAALPLKGEAVSLSAYARELNPHIHVTAVKMDSCLEGEARYDLVVSTDKGVAELTRLDARCRSMATRLVGCEVAGVCGFVFVDLLEGFRVEDALGETTMKEVVAAAHAHHNRLIFFPSKVPLGRLEVMEAGRVQVQSIDEEQLSFGIGDDFEIIGPAGDTVRATVERVHNTRSVVAALEPGQGLPSGDHNNLSARKVSFSSAMYQLKLFHSCGGV